MIATRLGVKLRKGCEPAPSRPSDLSPPRPPLPPPYELLPPFSTELASDISCSKSASEPDEVDEGVGESGLCVSSGGKVTFRGVDGVGSSVAAVRSCGRPHACERGGARA